MRCAAFGDVIGFEHEFDKSTQSITKRFDSLAPDVSFNPSKLKMVSDDTVMHLATARALLRKDVFVVDHSTKCFKFDDALFIETIREEYIECLSLDSMNGRAAGIQCLNAVQPMSEEVFPKYSATAGGNGATMRSMCIGLLLPHKWQMRLMVRASVISAAVTHNNATAILGAVMAATFTSLAIKLGSKFVSIWPQLFFGKYFYSDPWEDGFYQSIKDGTWNPSETSSPFELTFYYCREIGITGDWSWQEDHVHYFRRMWLDYQIRGPAPARIESESQWDSFWVSMSFSGWQGSSGHDAPMMAFDGLCDVILKRGPSTKSDPYTEMKHSEWRRLMRMTACHGGDSDSTATNAAAWYGVMFDKVDAECYQQFLTVEFSDEITSVSTRLFQLALKLEQPL